MILLLIGPQGSGKGTEGKLLSEALNLPLIGVGELLRDTPTDHPKYALIKQQMQKGVLVDYETTAAIIKERVAMSDCTQGYILDGWLRVLDELDFFNPHPDVVLYFNIPLEESIKRIAGRRIKDNLVIREDDNEEVVLKRQEIFNKETIPVIDMYRKKGKLVEIDAVGTINDVHLRALKALEINQSKS